MLKYFKLYGTYFLYSIIAVLEKYLAGFSFFSKEFYILYGFEIVLLFIYAIIWQKILKKFTLTTAYINKGSVFIYNAFWAFLLFNENFSIKEFLGMLLIIIGIIFINREV